MAKIAKIAKITTITDRDKWDKFVISHAESNFLQSWDFYEFHKNRGKTVVRRAAIDNKGNILAAYAGVVETAKRGTYLAIAGGPLIGKCEKSSKHHTTSVKAKDTTTNSSKDSTSVKAKEATANSSKNSTPVSEIAASPIWDTPKNDELTQAIFNDIRAIGKKHHCVFVRVRPQWELSSNSLELLKKLNLKPAPMYLSVEYAGILDLHQSEEEILAGASQGFRRKLRKAAKENLEITADCTQKSIEEFCDLEEKHAARQKYVAFSQSFLTKQFEAFKENGEVLIYTARKHGEILAQNFIIFYGPEASYHYGVSSELGTRISAAPLLHLKAMEEARKRGCIRYNLWGIVGRDEKEHRFYGVSEFKRSFGCEELKYTPAHDLILQPGKYQITKLIETARKKIRHV